jgi:mannan endo-1,4-beta-mannosidase
MHADPSNFGIPASSASAFLAAFISSRAAVAQAAGKPFILEETGMDVRAFLCSIISLSCSALPKDIL